MVSRRPRARSIQGPSGDQIDLVEDDALDINESTEGDETEQGLGEGDSDTDSLPDLSKEKGLRFHLKKKRKWLMSQITVYWPENLRMHKIIVILIILSHIFLLFLKMHNLFFLQIPFTGNNDNSNKWHVCSV